MSEPIPNEARLGEGDAGDTLPPSVLAQPILDPAVLERAEAEVWLFEKPASGAWILVCGFLLMAAATYFWLPDYRIAPALFLLIALWSLPVATAIDRLELRFADRSWQTSRGSWPLIRTNRGTFADFRAIVLTRAEPILGLADSPLRSHRLFLETTAHQPSSAVLVPGAHPDRRGEEVRARYGLGYPMGKNAAAHLAALAAEKTGLALIDETSNPEAGELPGSDENEDRGESAGATSEPSP